MFCPKCGKEVDENTDVCINCGKILDLSTEKEYNKPKTDLGILTGIFLGIIGLIIGICLFPEKTIARKTFVKSWLLTFLTTISVFVLIYFLFLQ